MLPWTVTIRGHRLGTSRAITRLAEATKGRPTASSDSIERWTEPTQSSYDGGWDFLYGVPHCGVHKCGILDDDLPWDQLSRYRR
jgi:hypothetical protein